jgi:hypothetical protein
MFKALLINEPIALRALLRTSEVNQLWEHLRFGMANAIRFDGDPIASMSKIKRSRLANSLEQIGSVASFSLVVITDAFRAPFEMNYVLEEIADQGCRSLPLIAASGMALGLVMTLHTRYELIRFGASAWIPEVQRLSFFVEIGPLAAALLLAGRVGAAMRLYAIVARIRLTSSDEVLRAAEDVGKRLLDAYESRRRIRSRFLPDTRRATSRWISSGISRRRAGVSAPEWP